MDRMDRKKQPRHLAQADYGVRTGYRDGWKEYLVGLFAFELMWIVPCLIVGLILGVIKWFS